MEVHEGCLMNGFMFQFVDRVALCLFGTVSRCRGETAEDIQDNQWLQNKVQLMQHIRFPEKSNLGIAELLGKLNLT